MKRFAIVTVAVSIAFWTLAACGGSEKKTETAPLPPDTAQTAPDTEPAEPAEPAEPTGPATDTAPTAAGEPYQPTPEEQAKLDELLGVIVSIGQTAEQNQDDCAALGNSIVQITQDNQELFEWADKTAQADPQKGQWLDAQASQNDEVIAATTKLQTAAQTCMNDPAFQQAMEQLANM